MREPLRTTRECVVCKKTIILQRGSGYIFKRINRETGMTEYFCGYTCKRSAEREDRRNG